MTLRTLIGPTASTAERYARTWTLRLRAPDTSVQLHEHRQDALAQREVLW